ncbi:MAG: PQ-loop repeat-containing protein [Alphaproteobacteria bacterium]|nr:PQ-loop repeat-containing protein [Alphaproteobacteria bacterium]
MEFIEVCGWIGSLSYFFYSLPQTVETVYNGKTNGISTLMILLIILGSFFSLLCILPDITSPLFYNFLGTLVCALILCKYHFFPRKKRS